MKANQADSNMRNYSLDLYKVVIARSTTMVDDEAISFISGIAALLSVARNDVQ